nr:MAG TPA: hypothetical protein [Caudoviricetes sp.]
MPCIWHWTAPKKHFANNAECFFRGIFAGRAEILKNPLDFCRQNR